MATQTIGIDFPKVSRMGRPRLLDRERESLLRDLGEHSPDTTLRTVQNWSYFGKALRILSGRAANLGNQSPYNWLLRPHGNTSYARKSIVSQLGRVASPTALKVFALQLCAMEPKAQDAIRMLRNWWKRYEYRAAAMVASGDPITTDTVEMISRWACGLERGA